MNFCLPHQRESGAIKIFNYQLPLSKKGLFLDIISSSSMGVQSLFLHLICDLNLFIFPSFTQYVVMFLDPATFITVLISKTSINERLIGYSRGFAKSQEVRYCNLINLKHQLGPKSGGFLCTRLPQVDHAAVDELDFFSRLATAKTRQACRKRFINDQFLPYCGNNYFGKPNPTGGQSWVWHVLRST